MKLNRKLNSTEQAMELLNRHRGAWNVVTVSCIRGNLTEDILGQSLDLVRIRHPLLRAQIIDRGSLDELYFVESETVARIPLEVIWQTESDSWQDIVVREIGYAIQSDRSLIKCYLVDRQSVDRRVYLVTKIHHAICDGLSTIELHSEILQNCHQIASGITVDSVEELPLIPPVEKLLPRWMNSKWATIGELFLLLKLRFKQKLYPLSDSTIEKLVPLSDRRCGMVHRRLNPESTQKLIALCRREKTSIQGALCAAMLLAVVDKIKKTSISKYNLVCHSYADLRRRLTPQVEREHITVLACFIVTFYRINGKILFWDLAREIYQKNSRSLSQGDLFKPIKYLRTIVEDSLTVCETVPMSVGVTNVGKVTIPDDYGLFQLESINFVAANPIFPGFLLAAVTTYQQKMYFNFTFSQPSVSQQTAEKMADYSIKLLTKMCQSKEEEKIS